MGGIHKNRAVMAQTKGDTCRTKGCSGISTSRGYCKLCATLNPAYPHNTVCAIATCSATFYRGHRPRWFCDAHKHHTECSSDARSSDARGAPLCGPTFDEPSLLPRPGPSLTNLVEVTRIKQRRSARLANKGMVAPNW
jgi:hypothetical protein